MNVNIPVTRLKKIINPFECSPWDETISMNDVQVALNEKRYTVEPSQDHAARIAQFVKFGWTDPIEVDIGVPCLQYEPLWPITDGNHRLAAAIFMRKRHILASVAGQVDYAKKILGVQI